jgi:hypothetical protein
MDIRPKWHASILLCLFALLVLYPTYTAATDIILRNSATGENKVWYMNGTTMTSSANLYAVADQTWTVVGTGDFNNDGKTDIVWRNTSTGQNIVWYMNGTTLTSWANLPAVADQSWQIVGTGDFNNDGKTDIVWRNSATADNVVWYMNGVNMTSWVALPANTDPSWKAVGTGTFASGTPNPFQGSLQGSWSGTCGTTNVSGGFSVSIDAGGNVSGSYNGDDSGPITGTVAIGGNFYASGVADGLSWSGTLSLVNASLSGSGTWNGSMYGTNCSGTWSGPSSATQFDAQPFTRFISQSMAQTVLGINFTSATQSLSQDPQHVKSIQSIQCTPPDNTGNVTCTFYIQIGPLTTQCAGGGYSTTSGDLTGSMYSDGLGLLQASDTVTFTNCNIGNAVINGDPYISATGQFHFECLVFNYAQINIGGGVKWVTPNGITGNAQINLTTIINSDGHGSTTGVITAHPTALPNNGQVNISF